VTFLNLHDFLTNKSFVFSIGFGEKSKKSQVLRTGSGTPHFVVSLLSDDPGHASALIRA